MNQLTHVEVLRKNQCKETNSIFQQSFPKNILHTMQSKRDRYIESVDEKQTLEKHKNEKHTSQAHTRNIWKSIEPKKFGNWQIS